ncbi:hypothetical protein SAMN02745206_02040 [Desulfacinum infernum DSM 9756]|jgi:hypothetical protein|uniref:Uncharacterized protein n=1 Tax=Desulfacinum infernum DSM 9756 TaxID=1121391 RepID=A0A1M5BVQ3_9BACT|nr:hypothetical protein [Desulfacinum infernum]MBC7357043.1 hypothetical protein [Desulfacinum sp.]MBZ4660212.1 hypothetical protein [Desulfacinum sp.]SHF46588.1 hypothetical protein SAMN02745206_02040 [Desulfacinum infernum DSM 9756]
MKPQTLVDASRCAVAIIQRNPELARVYKEAVQRYGEGELNLTVLELIAQAFQEGKLEEDVFKGPENLLSFCCGAWIQFLLVEFAGVKKTDLHAMARKLFRETHANRSIH